MQQGDAQQKITKHLVLATTRSVTVHLRLAVLICDKKRYQTRFWLSIYKKAAKCESKTNGVSKISWFVIIVIVFLTTAADLFNQWILTIYLFYQSFIFKHPRLKNWLSVCRGRVQVCKCTKNWKSSVGRALFLSKMHLRNTGWMYGD